MPQFSAFSRNNLAEADDDLQRLFNEVIKYVDCRVLDGGRSVEEQIKNVEKGVSMTMKSKHLVKPGQKSKAVDVVPYPVKWNDHSRMYMFVGFVRGVASQLGIKIRCGADWDSDFEVTDQKFIDLPHFEKVD